jgi:hypothetical protein
MSRRSYRLGRPLHPSSAVRTCPDAMAVRLPTRWPHATPPATAGGSLTGTENSRAHDHGGAVPGA